MIRDLAKNRKIKLEDLKDKLSEPSNPPSSNSSEVY